MSVTCVDSECSICTRVAYLDYIVLLAGADDDGLGGGGIGYGYHIIAATCPNLKVSKRRVREGDVIDDYLVVTI